MNTENMIVKDKTNKRSFRHELRVFLFNFAFFPALIFTLLVYVVIFLTTYYNIAHQNKNINTILCNHFNEMLNEFKIQMLQIATNPELKFAFENSQADADLYRALYSITDTGISSRTRHSEINHHFYLINQDLKLLASNKNDLPWYATEANDLNLSVLKKAMKNTGKVVTVINKQIYDDFTLPPITLAIAYNYEVGKTGFLCIDILYDKLTTLISRYSPIDVVLCDSYNNIAMPKISVYSDYLGKLKKSFQRTDRFFDFRPNHKFVSTSSIDEYGIVLTIITDTKITDHVIGYTGLSLVLVFIIIALASYKSAAIFSGKYTSVLEKIVISLQKVQRGVLNTRLQIDNPYEFHIISETFNKMTEDINRLIAANTEEANLRANAEIRQLESQFNPHFLFNTLETIRYLTSFDSQEANRMILYLSSLLRYSIDNVKHQVAFEEDVRNTINYLMIQKVRFKNRFSYNVNVENEANKCAVPKLIIQPIIENSIRHLEEKDSLEIEIKAAICDKVLHIEIQDDGPGIGAESLSTIRKRLNSQINASNHHGLFNVHRRIRLLYGEEYGVSLESRAGKGTLVKLAIPKIKLLDRI